MGEGKILLIKQKGDFCRGSYFNADTEYFGHFALDEGQPLGNFNWKDRLKHEGNMMQ